MAMTMGSSSSSSVLHIGSVKWFPNTWQHDYDDENDSLPAYTPYSYKYYANLPMSLVCSHLMDKATIKFDTPNLNFAESQTSKAMRIMTRMCFFLSYGAPNRMYIFTNCLKICILLCFAFALFYICVYI